MAALKGGSFSNAPTTFPSARWLSIFGSSKMRSASLPRSTAMAILCSKTDSGTSTLCGRGLIVTAPVLQTVLQTPHPRQKFSERTAHFFFFCPSVFSSIPIAPTGHAFTHRPQPLHFERSRSETQFDRIVHVGDRTCDGGGYPHHVLQRGNNREAVFFEKKVICIGVTFAEREVNPCDGRSFSISHSRYEKGLSREL
jgi:hypothetical protein